MERTAIKNLVNEDMNDKLLENMMCTDNMGRQENLDDVFRKADIKTIPRTRQNKRINHCLHTAIARSINSVKPPF